MTILITLYLIGAGFTLGVIVYWLYVTEERNWLFDSIVAVVLSLGWPVLAVLWCGSFFVNTKPPAALLDDDEEAADVP